MVECIAKAAKELLFVCILTLLFAYIYAVLGVTAFDYYTIDPDIDQPLSFPKAFDSVLDALKCMWQIFTNDHWLAVLFDARQVQLPQLLDGCVAHRKFRDARSERS